jgi:signal peptidase I
VQFLSFPSFFGNEECFYVGVQTTANWNDLPQGIVRRVSECIENRGGLAMKSGKNRQKGKARIELGIRTNVLGFLKEMLQVMACVLLINSFVLASFKVPTASMEDTVGVGDFLLVNKFIYGGTTPYSIPLTSIRIPHLRVPGFRHVERGDVIVFDWPGNRDDVEKPEQMYYLKRCIGLPGDTIRIDKRNVYVNGMKQTVPPRGKYLRPEPIPSGYRNPYIFPRDSAFTEDNYGPIVVPAKGSILSLNADSFPAWEVFIRREGHRTSLVDNKVLIDGVTTTRYVVERDYLFAMGDNRDNSLDSRFWGFVPIEDVIGTPMLVYWSWNPAIPLYHPIDKLLSAKLGRIGTIIR